MAETIDKLRLNNKFISFEGILGRRDYLLNLAYICIIDALFMIPVTLSILSNMESAADAFNPAKLFSNLPLFLKVLNIIVLTFSAFVRISNIIRRTNDITGSVNYLINTILSLIQFITLFGIMLPPVVFYSIAAINFIIILVLLFKKGKITGKYPHDFIKEFNWGAFFGTWIWGLFNKSYKTLWMWLLWFTPAGFWFAIVCGLKGNEWSYKNKKWENDSKFRRSQEIQTIVFIVLKLIVLPLIYIALFISLLGAVIVGITKLEKAPAHQKAAIANNIVNFAEKYALLHFDYYKIERDENKFYISPKDWSEYSFKEKKQIFDMAASLSSYKRNKANPKIHTTKAKELNRTKIYSSKTGELLGKFYIDTKINPKNADFKTIMKAMLNSYKFYNPQVK